MKNFLTYVLVVGRQGTFSKIVSLYQRYKWSCKISLMVLSLSQTHKRNLFLGDQESHQTQNNQMGLRISHSINGITPSSLPLTNYKVLVNYEWFVNCLTLSQWVIVVTKFSLCNGFILATASVVYISLYPFMFDVWSTTLHFLLPFGTVITNSFH